MSGQVMTHAEVNRRYLIKHPLCNKNYYNKRKEEYNKIIRELKSHPCLDCGNTYPFYVMDFDHRDPSKKKRQISQMINIKIENVLKEVAKCDLVCSNCHRVRTWRQQHGR